VLAVAVAVTELNSTESQVALVAVASGLVLIPLEQMEESTLVVVVVVAHHNRLHSMQTLAALVALA
jgi:hypothetical protein